MKPSDIFALLRPLKLRVMGMIGRGLVTLVDDSKRMQSLQFQGLGSETSDGIERFQNYGFTSVPKKPDADASGKGAECIIVAIGGDKSHEVVIVVDDRRFRFRGPDELGAVEGESAMYDDLGQYVYLQRDGIIVESTSIKLGDGATKGVARSSDTVIVNDSAFTLWMTAVDAAILVAQGFHPGIVPTTNPGSATGTITSGSSVVKAVD